MLLKLVCRLLLFTSAGDAWLGAGRWFAFYKHYMCAPCWVGSAGSYFIVPFVCVRCGHEGQMCQQTNAGTLGLTRVYHNIITCRIIL